MIKLMLNRHKFNNYAFFCPVSRLHLTVSSPVGFTNEVTPAILKAIKAKTILDVDGVIDIESGTVKEATSFQNETPEPTIENPMDNGDSKESNPPEESTTPEITEPEKTTEIPEETIEEIDETSGKTVTENFLEEHPEPTQEEVKEEKVEKTEETQKEEKTTTKRGRKTSSTKEDATK